MFRNKLKSSLIALVVLLALVAVVSVFAQEVTRSVPIKRQGKLGGQVLQKGDYSIKFSEDKDGELVVMKGGREVVKTPYKLAKLDKPAPETVIIYSAEADGSYTVRRIELKGKNLAIVLE